MASSEGGRPPSPSELAAACTTYTAQPEGAASSSWRSPSGGRRQAGAIAFRSTTSRRTALAGFGIRAGSAPEVANLVGRGTWGWIAVADAPRLLLEGGDCGFVSRQRRGERPENGTLAPLAGQRIGHVI